MTVRIDCVWEDWADRSVGLPAYESAGAAGADIRANLHNKASRLIAPMQRALIPTGLRLAVPDGFEAQIRPRSGLALNHGITLPNAPGTIDSDYRGELGVILVNLGEQTFEVTHGMRIAQMVIAPVLQAVFQRVEMLGDTTRSSSGFGSTGL